MEDPARGSHPLDSPLLAGLLSLPGALAGGAPAVELASPALAGRVPDAVAVSAGAFAGAALSLRAARLLIRFARALLLEEPPRRAARPGEPAAPAGDALQLVSGPDAS